MKKQTTIESRAPIFGENYNRGYIGFTYHDDHISSRGIAYFTRWARMSDIRVSHCFIVSCRNELIEALLKPGVHLDHIDKYFGDPHCHVFFRKPQGWTVDVGDAILYTAARQIGDKYDLPLILTQALRGTFLGRVINKLFKDHPDRLLSRLADGADRWICSELCAYCLDEQPALRDKGILADPVNTIDPQELFEDDRVFESWKCGSHALAQDG
jgi:hypothetical protein